MSKFSVKIEGMNRLVRGKMSGQLLYFRPMRHVMETIVEVVAGKAEVRAPKRTFRMAGSIESQVDSRPLPSWGKVTVGRIGVYPFVLNAGRRAPRGMGRVATKRRKPLEDPSGYILLHHHNSKRSTKGWFSGATRGMKKRAQQLLDWAAREVEQAWVR